MNILLLEDSPQIETKYLKYLEEKWHKLRKFWENFNYDDIEIIIIRTKILADKNLIEKFKNLKYIFRIWVWLDNVDIDFAKQKNIKVLNTPWANSKAVAELVIWWILSLLRKTYESWNFENRFIFMWDELENKNIWIIWFWNIAKKVFNLINAFWENNFFIYDPFLNQEEKNIYWKYLVYDKKDIFKNCDIITFHIPLNNNTKDFLWKDDFELLKPDVKIINTARWWIINENALYEFLNKNPQAWAYIDTLEDEKNYLESTLHNARNCIITPHIWAMTIQANKNMHFFEI